MKLSYTTLSVKELSIEEAIKIACQNKLDGIELRGMGNAHISPDSTFSYIQNAKNLLKENNLEVPCLMSYEKLYQRDKEGEDLMVKSFKKTLPFAAFINARAIRVFMGEKPEGYSDQELLDRANSIIKRVETLAENTGVKILIETHDSAQDGKSLKPILAGTTPMLGVIWDIIHPWTKEEDFKTTWSLIGDRVHHMHVKDLKRNLMFPGLEYSAIGEGILPVKEIVKHVIQNGYKGYFSLEWEKSTTEQGVSFEEAISKFVPYMRSFV